MSAAITETPTVGAEPTAEVVRASLVRRLLRSRRMVVGSLITGVVLAIAFVGPLFAPFGPSEIVGIPYGPPGTGSPLGLDFLGRDVLSRTLYGGRTVVVVAGAATLLGMLFGVTIGLLAGYSRNWLDSLLMRAMDVLQAFPAIILVLLFVSLLGTHTWLITLLVAIGWTPQVARLTRGITLEIVHRDFIRAHEILGTPTRTVVFREILPNLSSPLLVETALRLTWSIGLVAALSFIGFGMQPPTADWGLMVNENRQGISTQPWALLAPIACIGLLTVGITMVAEALSRELTGVDRRTSNG